MGSLQTKYAVFDGSKWTLIKAYSTDASVVWTPTKSGIYKINATVKDELGQTVTKEYSYIINNGILAITNFSTNLLSPQTEGNTIRLSAASIGGVGALQTRFVVFDGTTWKRITEYSSVTTTTWTPTKAGTYQVCAQVKDATGKMAEERKIYVINERIKITSIKADVESPQKVGTQIKINTTTEGGVGKLQTKCAVFDGKQWVLIRPYSTDSSVIWTPTKAGIYRINVTVKDELGQTSVQQLIYTISSVEIPITNVSVNVQSPQKVGTPITIKTISEGGVGKLQTKYAVFDGKQWVLIRPYSTDSNVIWTPTKAGIYQLNITVKDEVGHTVVRSLSYVINS